MQNIIQTIALVQPTNPIPVPPVTTSTLSVLINSIVQWMLTISTVVAVGFIIYGALLYMGVRGEAGKGEAGKILKNALIGVAIVFGVGLLLSTIARIIQTQSIG